MTYLLSALIVACLIAATAAFAGCGIDEARQRAFLPAAGFGLITLACGFLAVFMFAAVAFTEPTAICGVGCP